MKYRNYLLSTLAIVLMSASVNAAKPSMPMRDFDINNIVFIEEDQDWELGFDTAQYLPENFDPYSTIISVASVNFVDVYDEVDLGFETTGYLPENFDPYIQ
ncbi:MAG: hypothetical protein ABJN84_13370 [Flavobacteriaceae bacterium]